MYEPYKVTINFEAMTNVLSMLSNITGLRINFFTHGNNWIKTKTIDKSNFCSIIKSCDKGRCACKDSNLLNIQNAKKTAKPRIFRCYLGLDEGVIPLFHSGDYIGCFMFGQVTSVHQTREGWEYICEGVKDWGLDMEALKEAYFSVPYVDISKLQDLGSLLKIIAKNTLELEVISLAHQDLISITEKYIFENYSKEISLADIADYVHMNPSYLSFVYKKVKGITITDYITKCKINKAKEMLLTTNLSIIDITHAIGYFEQNYFTKVFKKSTGETPTAFRKKHNATE